jgi:hypothetical protein
MATTITPVGTYAGAISGATPAPVALNATSFGSAPAVALTTGTNVQYNFVNNGALIVVIYNTAAAGGTTWNFLIQQTVLGVSFAAATMTGTTPSTIGAYAFGPFGPSKFNDVNALCWVTQVGASAITSYIGLFTLPGAAS